MEIDSDDHICDYENRSKRAFHKVDGKFVPYYVYKNSTLSYE